jgi:glycosyltransferase involved in cell wall biosynthesis
MEGMPVSLMEAAACGRPAVATAVGGVPELVADGVTGLLVAPGDSLGLADALERLLRHPALRAAMGQAARARAERLFSLERQVDRLLNLWDQPARTASFSLG